MDLTFRNYKFSCFNYIMFLSLLTGLQENINEFIRFNNQSSNHINSNESNVILIQVPPKSDTLTDNDHFFNETHNHILNSNYVVCTADELPMQNKSKIIEQDEIINLCEGSSEVPWDINSATMLPTEMEANTSINPENNIKSKLQLCKCIIKNIKFKLISKDWIVIMKTLKISNVTRRKKYTMIIDRNMKI